MSRGSMAAPAFSLPAADARRVQASDWPNMPRAALFRKNTGKVVPEGGFEPPTRGFSIRCSTPELLGLHGKNRVGAQPIERRYAPWQAQNQSMSSPPKLSA